MLQEGSRLKKLLVKLNKQHLSVRNPAKSSPSVIDRHYHRALASFDNKSESLKTDDSLITSRCPTK